MAGRNGEFKFEIVNHIGVLGTTAGGYTLELNRVSFGGNEPKYDIRSWSPDHTSMTKGVTLTDENILALADLLQKEVDFLKEE